MGQWIVSCQIAENQINFEVIKIIQLRTFWTFLDIFTLTTSAPYGAIFLICTFKYCKRCIASIGVIGATWAGVFFLMHLSQDLTFMSLYISCHLGPEEVISDQAQYLFNT